MSHQTWKRWIRQMWSGRRSVPGRRAQQRGLHLEMLEERVTPATFIWTGSGGNNN